MKAILIHRGTYAFLTSIAISIIIFVIILQIRIPYSFSKFFAFYSLPLFLLIWGLFYLSFNNAGITGRVLALSLAMALFALTLSYKWTSGYSDATIIGGILPYKDGFDFYNGSRFLLMGDRIPGANWPPAWRPLFPSFFASILFLVMQNLKWAVAALAGMVAVCCFMAAQQITKSMGALAGSLFFTLLYLFIQPMLGNPLTELHGMTLGILGFISLWRAARSKKKIGLILGIVVFVAALSTRAGAFFTLPMLVFWAGWAFKEKKRFSFQTAAIVLITLLVSFISMNILFPWIITGAGGSTFGNFAYSLYGQVKGGTGWESVQSLETLDTQSILQMTLQEFREHPSNLLLGIEKSFRDFFFPSPFGIYSFISINGLTWHDAVLWLIAVLLLILSIIRTLRVYHSPEYSLLLFVLLGILLSIPFLPPIDGGRRFHASTMPFFFAIMVASIGKIPFKDQQTKVVNNLLPLKSVQFSSLFLIFLTLGLPIVVLFLRHGNEPDVTPPECPSGHIPFSVQVNPESFLDLFPDNSSSCGLVPEICLSDFRKNGPQIESDDFYHQLIALAEDSKTVTRIVPANDLIDGGVRYYVGSPDQLNVLAPDRIVSGCASHIRTRNQSIFLITQIAN